MPTSLVTMNGNVLAALDVETTGREPWTHEVCQIGVVPLDCHVQPTGKPFYSNINPEHPELMSPEAIDAHGLTVEALSVAPGPHAVAESMWDWFQGLNLPPGKRLIPLCHNSQFDIPFIQRWLGYELYADIFGFPTRDTQSVITGIIDRAAFKGHKEVPFNGRAGLKNACSWFGIDLTNAHDALADSIATASLYRHLLSSGNV